MMRILGTIFVGLLGLAFGSFLNVCLSRWPEDESIVLPSSHCRHCTHTLAWWENVPLVSWLALRGRCRSCRAWIGWRYPLVEFAVGALWATAAWHSASTFVDAQTATNLYWCLADVIGKMIFYWLMIALAVLDAENLWLPDLITLPGMAFGFAFASLSTILQSLIPPSYHRFVIGMDLLLDLLGIVFAAGLIFLIRWAYGVIRHREGIGLGDVKLMAVLGAWLGFPGALLAFALGVLLGAIVAIALLIIPAERTQSENWALTKLPLGTFLCIGGVVSSLCGGPIWSAYLRWAGL